eukprot:12751131-Heterocapsa_arctica.AAC.1
MQQPGSNDLVLDLEAALDIAEVPKLNVPAAKTPDMFFKTNKDCVVTMLGRLVTEATAVPVHGIFRPQRVSRLVKLASPVGVVIESVVQCHIEVHRNQLQKALRGDNVFAAWSRSGNK